MGDEEAGGSGEVAEKILGGPHMRLGRLGHSLCQLIHGEDAIPGNLSKVEVCLTLTVGRVI